MRVSQRYDFILEFSRIWTTATFLLNIRHAAIVWGITACLLISFNSGSAALGAVVRYIGTPIEERYCKYCKYSGTETLVVDDEKHLMLHCRSFNLKRQCFFGKLSSLGVVFPDLMSEDLILSSLLCPTSAVMAKTVSKFIKILFKSRKLLDEGATIDQLGYRDINLDYEDDEDVNDNDDSDDISLDDDSGAETT